MEKIKQAFKTYLQRLYSFLKELEILCGLEVLFLYFPFGDVRAFSFVLIWPELKASNSSLFYYHLSKIYS